LERSKLTAASSALVIIDVVDWQASADNPFMAVIRDGAIGKAYFTERVDCAVGPKPRGSRGVS
jgi:hypothetical protein